MTAQPTPPTGAPMVMHVAEGLLHATARRFSPVADRRWVVEADAGTVQGSAERLRRAWTP